MSEPGLKVEVIAFGIALVVVVFIASTLWAILYG